jgi:hypothetical protein
VPLPNYLSFEIIHAENPIQNIHTDIGVGVPVAMQKNTSGGLQNTVHFRNPLFKPRNIMIDTAGLPVLKTADFPRVSPDDLVIAVAEKGRVKVDKVYTHLFQGFQDFEVVAEDKFIY